MVAQWQKDRAQQFIILKPRNIHEIFDTLLQGIETPISTQQSRLDFIVVAWCAYTGTDYKQFLSTERFQPLSERRYQCYRIIRTLTMGQVSYPAIANYFNRGHKSVARGVKRSSYDPLTNLPTLFPVRYCEATETPIGDLFQNETSHPLPDCTLRTPRSEALHRLETQV